MKIIVDAMGGDNAPDQIIQGSIDAVNEYGVSIILVGDESKIKDSLSILKYPIEKVEILNSTEVIDNNDDPANAIRRKKDSSTVVGLKALNDGLGDGFISAGNTGALLAGGMLIVKRIEGLDRAALTVLYPTLKGMSLLVDAGANMDARPTYLKQFAIMGSIYMEKVMGINNPKIGLVNVGSEPGKGNEQAKETYNLLLESSLNFTGNIEARELPKGAVDVIVCDGFVGNVILKLTEGMASSIFQMLKRTFLSSFKTKLGALLVKKDMKKLKNSLDYREFGGAPLLGTKKPIVKAHGSSDAYAFKNGIRQLKDFVENDIIEIIETKIN